MAVDQNGNPERVPIPSYQRAPAGKARLRAAVGGGKVESTSARRGATSLRSLAGRGSRIKMGALKGFPPLRPARSGGRSPPPRYRWRSQSRASRVLGPARCARSDVSVALGTCRVRQHFNPTERLVHRLHVQRRPRSSSPRAHAPMALSSASPVLAPTARRASSNSAQSSKR